MKISKELLEAIGFSIFQPACNLTGDPETYCGYGMKIHPCRAEGAEGLWVIWNGTSKQSLVETPLELINILYSRAQDEGYRARSSEVVAALKDLMGD